MKTSHRAWTEKKIARMLADGYGAGTLAGYKPWIDVRSISSLGRSRRVLGKKTGRIHHLLSDIEYNLFLALEWQPDIVDIREQFPLDRDLTQTVADEMGVRHPCYPGTDVKAVMTADFLVTRVRNGTESLEAFNAKHSNEAGNARSLEKLEIQRRFFAQVDVPHHLVLETSLPKQRIKNLEWIRDSELKEGEIERFAGHWDGISRRLLEHLTHLQVRNTPLMNVCVDFDAVHGLQPGTGLRAARMLMSQRAISVDLSHEEIQYLPLTQFQVYASRGQLRAVGGR